MQLQSITVDGQIIEFSSTVTSLGLTISADLRWDCYINGIVAVTNRILYFLNSRARGLPFQVKKLVASQLLFPHFDYPCTVFLDLTSDIRVKLDRQLNKALRFVLNLPCANTSDLKHE